MRQAHSFASVPGMPLIGLFYLDTRSLLTREQIAARYAAHCRSLLPRYGLFYLDTRSLLTLIPLLWMMRRWVPGTALQQSRRRSPLPHY